MSSSNQSGEWPGPECGLSAAGPFPITEGTRTRNRLRWLLHDEREVLGLMAEGRTNAAIAEALVVTGGAVEKHVSSIFGKLRLPPSETDHRRVLADLAYLRAQPPRRPPSLPPSLWLANLSSRTRFSACPRTCGVKEVTSPCGQTLTAGQRGAGLPHIEQIDAGEEEARENRPAVPRVPARRAVRRP